MIQVNFRRFCMESSDYIIISPHQLIQYADFWQGCFFHLVLFEYASHSHYFSNLNFYDVILLFSVTVHP